MHFEFLVEDASGKIALSALVPKILKSNSGGHTFRIIAYRGIGKVPKGLRSGANVQARMLLDQLPRLLQGYGQAQRNFPAAVVVVVDLDRRDRHAFDLEWTGVLNSCEPAPVTLFGVAIEEMEAWLLGDRAALLRAYSRAKPRVLAGYEQDAICDTWELLADAIHAGGAAALKKEGWPAPGRAKCAWATAVAPHMDVETNQSPSFQAFRDGVRGLCSSANAG